MSERAAAGIIHPQRTTFEEVAHATSVAEVAWGRYVRTGRTKEMERHRVARARALRLIKLLATQNDPAGTRANAPESRGAGRLEGDEGKVTPAGSGVAHV